MIREPNDQHTTKHWEASMGSEDPIMSRPLHHYWTMALNLLLLTTLDNNSLNRPRQNWVLPIIISQFCGKVKRLRCLVNKLFVWISRAFISDVTTAAGDSNSWSSTDFSSFRVLNLKKLRSLHFSSSKPWDSVALQLTPSQWPGTWLGCLSEGRRKIFRFSGRAWGQLAHNKSQQWRGPSACQYKVYQGKVGHVGDDWWPTGHLPLTRVQPGLQVILY